MSRDAWDRLRQYTDARIAMGRVGDSMRTEDLLAFQRDHARARDAIHIPLDARSVIKDLGDAGAGQIIHVRSQAKNRSEYLKRPDLGRNLADDDQLALPKTNADLSIIVADGLSSKAVTDQAPHVVQHLLRELAGLSLAPIVLATQARVGLGDDIGLALGVKLTIMLIGERPGLSAADSLGAYLTFAPRPGRQNAERNCVSNIRPGGTGHGQAASKIAFLARQALNRELTGIALKDDTSDLIETQ